ncbi:MAG TPA: M23 family metallopeptidase [Anaerolineaceae bacterium]|nr:M23 family metallopeptidase [Anaerolineaceae bacterium]
MAPKTRTLLIVGAAAAVLVAVAGGYLAYRHFGLSATRTRILLDWLRAPQDHPEWAVKALERCDPGAPFSLPTSGLIGYLWDDSFQIGKRHQGLDIFGGTGPGLTPIYAAYPGFLTRLSNWKSSLIVRVPDDPLHPGLQIWTYYTHMADSSGENSYIAPDFPPGTSEVSVQAGQLLGYQGNFSGDPSAPVGVHLHFSIVLDDGQGKYRNELDIANTLDPSPYFGLPLNGSQNRDVVPVCQKTRSSTKWF